jgi:hypothetical protein
VQYGIGAMLNPIEHDLKEDAAMKMNLKVALSALALAALVAVPAVAKSRTHEQSAPAQTYSNNTVYGEGHTLGTDPDPRVRSELLRDGNPAYTAN